MEVKKALVIETLGFLVLKDIGSVPSNFKEKLFLEHIVHLLRSSAIPINDPSLRKALLIRVPYSTSMILD